jgi:hypothetical protein
LRFAEPLELIKKGGPMAEGLIAWMQQFPPGITALSGRVSWVNYASVVELIAVGATVVLLLDRPWLVLPIIVLSVALGALAYRLGTARNAWVTLGAMVVQALILVVAALLLR